MYINGCFTTHVESENVVELLGDWNFNHGINLESLNDIPNPVDGLSSKCTPSVTDQQHRHNVIRVI